MANGRVKIDQTIFHLLIFNAMKLMSFHVRTVFKNAEYLLWADQISSFFSEK